MPAVVVETAPCSWEDARRLPGVAGRIRDDDIAEVREKARIDDVISGYVTLKRAGGGTLKGLCPFHDEKTPSFNVNPSRKFYHCFGCGEGGDVISFLMKVDGLTFTETVERLAEKVGVQLRREDGDDEPQRPRGPARARLIEAHKVAQEFYAEQLATPDALVARQFLGQRGFDQSAAELFGVGFAPRDGEALTRHLRARRFTDEESVAAGLVALGRSHYDRFRGRLVWPIREANGDTIGFGARRIFDDDRIEAKYLNTSETAIYKKSHVLYGIDLARTAMKDSQQAVVVEGYTDVMACHLAGVTTAVASCGTAFGQDHAKVLRRFMGDHGPTGGEVIFTFDGDSAGQKAAMKVLDSDHVFASQTYVAVAPEGMDPCDLRLQGGRRGGAGAGRQAAAALPLRPRQHPRPLRPRPRRRPGGRPARRGRTGGEHPRQDQGRLVLPRARAHGGRRRRPGAQRGAPRGQPAGTAPGRAAYDPGRRAGGSARAAPTARCRACRIPRFLIERELLKLVIQHPAGVGRTTTHVTPDDFTHPTFQGVWAAVTEAGGPADGAEDPAWSTKVRGAATDPAVVAAVTELGVEPVRGTSDPNPTFAVAYVYRLQERTTVAPDRRRQGAPPAHQPGRAAPSTTTGCSASW